MRRNEETRMSEREHELQSKERKLSAVESEMKQSHEAAEDIVRRRERELEAAEARLLESQNNATKWIAAAEKAQVRLTADSEMLHTSLRWSKMDTESVPDLYTTGNRA